nr:zinc finger BED domain-containing protein RICESLEEPER 2 [Tanacetum cinerariifolium]
AFSTGGRVLDPYRTRLSTTIVEVLICTQDWVRKSRTQINWDDDEDLIKDDEMVKDMEEQLGKLFGRDKAKQTVEIINVSSYFVGQSLKLFYFVIQIVMPLLNLENVVEISSDKVEGSGDWNSPEPQDTANSGQKKETKAMVFHQMDTEEVSDRFVAPLFINGLEAYDGEINLRVEENMISNEYAIKLCLEHEVKRGNKVVKKELIVALRGEIYFVKFIINPEEDNVEPGVTLRRSFLGMTKAVTDFRAGTVTICPKFDSFLEDIEEEEKSLDDWDHLLDFNLDDVPLLGGEGLLPFVELDGKIVKEEEEAVQRIKGEALKEKDDPRAFIFLIRLEGKVNENALADTGSDINTMSGNVNLEGVSVLQRPKWVCECGLVDWEVDEEERSWHSKGNQICCGKFISKIARKSRALTHDVLRSLSAPIYCRDLDTTTLRDLIDCEGKLIPEDPQSGVLTVGISRPPRASMQDLYDRMSRMEIRQEAIERMDVPLQGAYNSPGYAQPQYDQYYQQFPPPPPQYLPHQQHHQEMMSSVEMTQVGYVTACFGSRMF